MEIKTIKDLKQAIDGIEDDFIIDINLITRIPDEQLKGMSYPYPYAKEGLALEFHDIGYSSKIVLFGAYKVDGEQ